MSDPRDKTSPTPVSLPSQDRARDPDPRKTVDPRDPDDNSGLGGDFGKKTDPAPSEHGKKAGQ